MANINSGKTVDLVNLFGSVAQTMIENQSALNKADNYNHDHGDNMVQIFNTITKAVQAKSGTTAAAQLNNASTALSKITTSGSAKLYSEGLQQAASQFTGKKTLNSNDAMQLIQLLLGSTNAGGAAAGTTGTGTSAGADLLGTLLGGLGGTTTTQSPDDSQIDLGDIVNAGMAFLEAKQSGKSTLDSVLSALVTDSKVANQDYRSQSATLVANALVNVVTQLASAKK
jgi:hypothetical protein